MGRKTSYVSPIYPIVSLYSKAFFSISIQSQALQREADRKKPPIENMSESHQQLAALNPEMTAKAEVTLKLDSVRTPYQDLCRKLGE